MADSVWRWGAQYEGPRNLHVQGNAKDSWGRHSKRPRIQPLPFMRRREETVACLGEASLNARAVRSPPHTAPGRKVTRGGEGRAWSSVNGASMKANKKVNFLGDEGGYRVVAR